MKNILKKIPMALGNQASKIGCSIMEVEESNEEPDNRCRAWIALSDDRPVLLLAPAAQPPGEAHLQRILKDPGLRLASSAETLGRTGMADDCLPPFPPQPDWPVYVDAGLLAFENLLCETGTPRTLFSVKTGELVRCLDAVPLEIARPAGECDPDQSPVYRIRLSFAYTDFAGDICHQLNIGYRAKLAENRKLQDFFTENPARNWDVFLRRIESARRKTTRLIGAPDPRHVMFTTGTADGIGRILGAFSTDERENILFPDQEVVTTDSEFPNLYFELVNRFQVRIARLQDAPRSEIADRITTAVTSRSRMIILSHVWQRDGTLLPMREIVAAIKAKNPRILVLVDGSQAFGQVPVDVDEIGCDFYAGDYHKWIQGPNSTGFLYIRSGDHLDYFVRRRRLANPFCFAANFPARASCTKSGLVPYGIATLDWVLDGVAAPESMAVIRNHNRRCSSHFIQLVNDSPKLGNRLLSSRNPRYLSGMVSFKFKISECRALCHKLRERSIPCSAQEINVPQFFGDQIRPVAFLRFSFFDLWNSKRHVETCFEELRQLINQNPQSLRQ